MRQAAAKPLKTEKLSSPFYAKKLFGRAYLLYRLKNSKSAIGITVRLVFDTVSIIIIPALHTNDELSSRPDSQSKSEMLIKKVV